MVYLAEKGRIPQTAARDLVRGVLDPEHPIHELPVDASIALDTKFIVAPIDALNGCQSVYTEIYKQESAAFKKKKEAILRSQQL